MEPEIPQNTGNIGRTCVGTNCHLHLIEPLGFEINDKQLRRAGLDYWQHLKCIHHASYADWWAQVPDKTRVFFFTTKVDKPHYRAQFKHGDWLVFGKETKGLQEELLAVHHSQCLTIPKFGPIRSYNLSNAVAMVLMEGVRQLESMPN